MRKRTLAILILCSSLVSLSGCEVSQTEGLRVMDPPLWIIVGGAIIVCAIMRYFELSECLVSEADILDGLVLSLRGSGTQ